MMEWIGAGKYMFQIHREAREFTILLLEGDPM